MLVKQPRGYRIDPTNLPVMDFTGMGDVSETIRSNTEEKERQFNKLKDLSSKELLGKSRTIIIDCV